MRGHLFIADIDSVVDGDEFVVIGFTREIRKTRDHYAVHIADISGSHWFRTARTSPKPQRGERIRLNCRKSSEHIEVSGTTVILPVPQSGQEPDSERIERGARLMLSRVAMKAGERLRHDDFVEFESRIIMAADQSAGLEPLQLLYPGFGSPVTLATSPAGQIIDFMNVTGVSRAFTTSVSFSTSYRFPNGSVESRIIMGKMTDIQGDDLLHWSLGMCRTLLAFLDNRRFSSLPSSDSGLADSGLLLTDEVHHSAATSHIGSVVTRLIRLASKDSSIVLESYEESILDRFVFSGFTLYPSHLLELTNMSPRRHVRYNKRAMAWFQ